MCEARDLRQYTKDLTADFSVIGPYRMMATDGSTEKPTRPIVHAWCVRVNINATRCETVLTVSLSGDTLRGYTLYVPMNIFWHTTGRECSQSTPRGVSNAVLQRTD